MRWIRRLWEEHYRMRISTIKNREKKEYFPEKKKAPAGWLALSVIWIIIWQAAAWLAGSELLLPGPYDTLKALGRLLQEKAFYFNAGWTIGRCFLAVILSLGAGALASWGAYRFPPVRRLLSFPVAFFKAVPVMAVVIYIILLADSDWVAVIVCFLLCFPVVYTNLLEGLEAVASDFLELAAVCKIKGKERIRLFFIPGILPQIKSACELAAGLSWKAVVAAEVLSIPRYSLGYEMLNAKYYLETDILFAYIAVIVFLSWLFTQGVRVLLRNVEWKPYQKSRVYGRYGKGRGIRMKEEKTEQVMASAPEIVVSHLDKSFDGKKVLKDFSVIFPAGKITALMGPSGQGKTTLMRMIAGLDFPDRGEIRLKEKGGCDAAPGETATAFLFQEDRLLPWLNVFDNIALPLLNRGMDEKEIKRQVEKMAESLELQQALYQLPGQLSGGMRSRAALGRTFLMPGKLLILDEPFKGIDESLKKRILAALWGKNTKGRTVILVTHSREDGEALSDQTELFQPAAEAERKKTFEPSVHGGKSDGK